MLLSKSAARTSSVARAGWLSTTRAGTLSTPEPHGLERAVPARIRPAAPRVVRPVHLHNEPRRRSEEIHDEALHHHLAPKLRTDAARR